MEEKSTRRQSGASPIQSMESVVATVSGYHGSERFKLIKLISQAGGSYVGVLNQSTTHLVCWKFEGRKYEIARKFKMMIVNHMWVEDCLKQGKRVPEHSYTLCCGKEIGPLLMDIPVVANKASHLHPDKSIADNNPKKHGTDVECEENDHAVWTDSSLLKENLLPELERNNKSYRSKRKVVKESLRQDPLFSARFCFDEPPLSCYTNMEPEELGSSSRRWVRQNRSTSSVEPSCRGRKLVRKNITSDVLEALSESEEDCHPAQVHNWHDDITAPSSNSSGWSNRSMLRIRGASNDMSYNRGVNRIENSEDVEEIKDFNGLAFENLSSPEGASTSPVNALVDQTSIRKDSNEIEPVTRSSKSTELSCVICWTDFSSTRGVLPCGHRFCFPCIQSWADHMSASRKISTCPLCKASFVSITKVDDAVSSDQKIYSQTIPHDPSVDIYILPNHEAPTSRAPGSFGSNTCLPLLLPHMSHNSFNNLEFGYMSSSSELYIYKATCFSNPCPLSLAPICSQCCCREPEDLLIICHFCQIRCVHSYCLDPYMLPWTCVHCKDLRRLYHHFH